MKKTLVLAILAVAVSITACKKDSKKGNDPFKLGYSNLTTEEHKQNLEKSGREFVQKIDGLKDEPAIDVLNYLAEIGIAIESDAVSGISSIGAAGKKKNVSTIFEVAASSETRSLSELYGVYTWNSQTEKWVESSSSDRLEFKFPSSESSTSNNAVLTFTYTKSGVTLNSDGEKTELPASINGVLKVDNSEIMKLASSYSYKSDGTPTKTNASLTIGSYTFKTNASNTGSKPEAGFSLEKGSEKLLGMSVAAKGNLSVDLTGEDDFDQIIHNANATFEIMNVKLVGTVDIDKISRASENWDELDEEGWAKEEAKAWNKYSQFVAIDKSSNTVIARNEFITEEKEDCYTNYDNTEYCYSYYSLEPRLVFKDGSKMSFGEFFENGFDGLISDLEDLFSDFE